MIYCENCGFKTKDLESLPRASGIGTYCPECGFDGAFLAKPPKVKGEARKQLKKDVEIMLIKRAFFDSNGHPKCASCGVSMKRVGNYDYKLDCVCVKKHPSLTSLRMSVG